MFWILAIIIWGALPFLIAYGIGRHKRIGFWGSLFACLLLSPFLGFLITANSRLKNARGCGWCGNKDNEAEYCGICGKNEKGDIKPGFVARSRQ